MSGNESLASDSQTDESAYTYEKGDYSWSKDKALSRSFEEIESSASIMKSTWSSFICCDF